MRRLKVMMFVLLIAAQFSVVFGQQTKLMIWKGDSITTSVLTTDIDSVTFETEYKKDLGNGIYLINGHRFVDLGLPSGLLWAETNIGAETATDYGTLFRWGEAEEISTYMPYKYKGTSGYTKYTKEDGKTILDNTDDAAWVNWGSYCRMPSYDDFEELLLAAYTKKEVTTLTDSLGSTIYGLQITGRSNGNSIFFPCKQSDKSGKCWQSSVYEWNSYQYAKSFSIYCDHSSTKYDYSTNCPRVDGLPVRAVAEK